MNEPIYSSIINKIKGKNNNERVEYNNARTPFFGALKGQEREKYIASKTALLQQYEQMPIFQDVLHTSLTNLENTALRQSLITESFNNSIDNYMSGATNVAPRITAFDIETIATDITESGQWKPEAALTELGITTGRVNTKGKYISENTFDIAFGINEHQAQTYLQDIFDLQANGLNYLVDNNTKFAGRRKTLMRSYESEFERLSRYSGDMSTLFTMKDLGIQSISKSPVVTINKLSEGSGDMIADAIEGVLNLSALHGVSSDDMTKMLNNVLGQGLGGENPVFTREQINNYSILYNDILRDFNKNGLLHQQLNDRLFVSAKQYLIDQTNASNSYVINYNGSNFDVPSLNAVDTTSVLNSNNMIDSYAHIYSANKGMGNTMAHMKQEEIAKQLGIRIDAHNAEEDIRATVETALDTTLFNGLRPTQASKFNGRIPGIDKFTEFANGTPLFAMNSIDYDKSELSKDLLIQNGEVANSMNIKGIKRNKYYTIDKLSIENSGETIVGFKGIGYGNEDVFYKTFQSYDKAIETIQNTFVIDSKATMEKINRQNIIANADSARRVYDSFFEFNSIEAGKNGSFTGGYDALNKYYQAYRITAEEIGDSEDVIRKIRETSDFDAVIEDKLKKHFGYEKKIRDKDGNILKNAEGKEVTELTVSPSVVRNFKSMYGRLSDEKEFLEDLTQNLNSKKLDNYQRTYAAKKYRDSILEEISGVGYTNITERETKNIANASRRDMFNITVEPTANYKHANKMSNIVFNLERDDAKFDLYNSVMRNARALQTGDDNQAAINILKSTIGQLGPDGIGLFNTKQTKKLLKKIHKDGINANPFGYAEAITDELRNIYVNPIIKTGFTFDDFQAGDFSKIKSSKLLQFFDKKGGIITGGETSKIFSNKFSTIYGPHPQIENDITFDMLYKSFKGNKNNINDAISEARKIKINAEYLENDIIHTMKENLGYSKDEAEQVWRTLFQKGGYGIGARKEINSNVNKTDYITTFVSPQKGEDAFILVNKTDSHTYGNMLDKLVEMTDSNYKDVIKDIKESGDAFVMRVPAIINNGEIFDDKRKEFFRYIDYEYNEKTKKLEEKNLPLENKIYKQGEKDFYRSSRKTLNAYKEKSNNGEVLESLDARVLKITDDVEDLNKGWQLSKNTILEILEEAPNERDAYIKASKHYDRTLDRVFQEMPGLSGYHNVIWDETNNIWRKVPLQVAGDIAQSNRINISALQGLFIKTALDTNNNDMLELIAHYGSGSGDIEDIAKRMLETLDKRKSLSPEFEEMFLKHAFILPFESNNTLPTFKNGMSTINGTIIDYLHDNLNNFHIETQKTISMLYANNIAGNISQIAVKEHDTSNFFISLMNEVEFNPNFDMQGTARPTTSQQLAILPFQKDLQESSLRKILGDKRYEQLDLRIGYDAPTIQYGVSKELMKNKTVYGNITYGDLEKGLSMNIRNIDYNELASISRHADKNFNEFILDNLKNAGYIAKFGLSGTKETADIIRTAFDVINTNYNTFESKGVRRASVANSFMYTKPNIRKFDFNGVIENKQALDEMSQFLFGLELHDGDNISELFRKATGTRYFASIPTGEEKDLIYHGKSGKLNGTEEDIKKYLNSGEGYMEETYQGMRSVKIFNENEKMTITTPEWGGKQLNEFRNKLEALGVKDNKQQEKIFYKITDAIEDILMGTRIINGEYEVNLDIGRTISGFNSAPYSKHMNADSVNTNTIMNWLQKEYAKDKDGTLALARQLFSDAAVMTQDNWTGITIDEINGELVKDTRGLGVSGSITQVENVIKIIDANPGRFKDLIKQLDINSAWGIHRVADSIGSNQENTGERVFLDSRIGVIMRSQGLEDVKEKITDINKKGFNTIIKDGEEMYTGNFIYQTLREKGWNLLSKERQNSINNTIAGIGTSLEYLGSGAENISKSTILQLKLDDIAISSDDIYESLETGIFKLNNENGVRYSKRLQELANGRDLNAIQALEIQLPKGVSYDLSEKLGGKKNLTSVVVPLMDITPYENEVHLNTLGKHINKVISVAKEFGIDKGVSESRAELSKAVTELGIQLGNDISTNKKSYFFKNKLRTEIPNSGIGISHSIVAPNTIETLNPKSNWTSQADEYIEAIKKGYSDKFNLENFASEEHGYKFSRFVDRDTGEVVSAASKNARVVYDNIQHLSLEAFEEKGVDFAKTGETILKEMLESESGFNRMSRMMTGKDLANALDIISESNLEKTFRKGSLQGNIKAALEAIEDGTIDSKFTRQITEEYLTKIGTLGISGRWPTFMEASVNVAVTRLDKSLSRDEIRLSTSLGIGLNDDNDGDKPFYALMHEKGILNESSDFEMFRAMEERYRGLIDNGTTNRIFAEEIQSHYEKQLKNGGYGIDRVSDVMIDKATGTKYHNIYGKSESLLKQISDEQKEQILASLDAQKANIGEDIINQIKQDGIEITLGIDNVLHKAINDKNYIKDDALNKVKAIDAIYKEFDKIAGNSTKNIAASAASTKAHYTKAEIGFVSNVNYYLNEALETELHNAFIDGNKEKLKQIQKIKKILHVHNEGFLPKTEQTSIDVKHLTAGLPMSETKEYASAVKGIFSNYWDGDKWVNSEGKPSNNGIENALKQMYAALKNNSSMFDSSISEKEFVNNVLTGKGTTEAEIGTQALLEFSKIASLTNKRIITHNLNTKIQSEKDLQKIRTTINESMEDTYGEIGRMHGAQADLYNSLMAQYDYINMRYTNKNTGSSIDIVEGKMYFQADSTNGAVNPSSGFDGVIPTRINNVYKTDDGNWEIDYTTFDDKGKKVYQTTKKGTAPELNQWFEDSFSDFNSQTEIEMMNNIRDSKYNIPVSREEISNANARRFLEQKELYARQDEEYTLKQFISSGSFDQNSKSFKFIQRNLQKIEGMGFAKDDIIDFNNKIRYINSRKNINEKLNLDDILHNINKEIIESSKNKTTSTTINDILINTIKGVAQDVLTNGQISDLINNSGTYKNWLSEQKPIDANFFDEFDKQRRNIQQIKRDLEDLLPTELYTVDENSDILNRTNIKINNIIKGAKDSNDIVGKTYSELYGLANSQEDINALFGFNQKDLSTMRVAYGAENEYQYFGKQFGELSENEVNAILRYNTDNLTGLQKYAAQQTKRNLIDFQKAGQFQTIQTSGATDYEKDIISHYMDEMADNIRKKGSKEASAARNQARQEEKEALFEKLEGLTKKVLDGDYINKGKQFVKNHPTGAKVGLALAGLGILSNVMGSKSSPLAPELDASNNTKPSKESLSEKIENYSPMHDNSKIYTNNGIGYKMSGKAMATINHQQVMQTANGITGGQGGNVSVYNDNSKVTDAWLQQKFSDLI